MCPQIAHLYGPFAINTFGIFVALGLIVFAWFTLADSRRKALIDTDSFLSFLTSCLIVGLIGGRLLYILFNWQMLESYSEILQFWHGGFSSLGVVVALICFIPWYLQRRNISILPFLDLIATYAPLLQSIARIGCFFAGCCYGSQTSQAWGVIFPYPIDSALTGIALHPAQLYSSALLMLIFIVMFYGVRRLKAPGSALFAYLFLMSIERFVTDFFRSDQEFFGNFTLISSHQILALGIAAVSLVGFIVVLYHHRKKSV